MPRLVVRMVLEVSAEGFVTAPSLKFSRWLPITDDEAIVCSSGDLTVKLWFDVECTRWATRVEQEDLHRHVVVHAHRIYADITVADVDENLLEFIRTRDYAHATRPDQREAQDAYNALAWRVLAFAVEKVNRLIAYARSRFQQFWLTEHELDPDNMSSHFVHFKSKATIDGTTWFRFGSENILRITAHIDTAPNITREQWRDVREFVAATSKAPLVGTLLAGAKALAAQGHGRAALTEAITALEVAVYDFARSPRAEAVAPERLRERLGLETLRAQVKHLGLTATVSYLLPMFPEELFPSSVLKACRAAIAQRQNVVHKGQRDVGEEALTSSLRAVSDLCRRLEALTLDVDASKRPAPTEAPTSA